MKKVILIGGVDSTALAAAALRAAESMREMGAAIAEAMPKEPHEYIEIRNPRQFVERKPEPWQGKGKRRKGRIK